MSYIGNQPINQAFLVDTFSGNGSTTAFTLTITPPNPASILVTVSGVVQDPTTYSVSGTTLTFSAAPPTGSGNISVRYLSLAGSNVTTTAYRNVTDLTATSGQTTFAPASYTPGFINVYRNGVRLGAADYTATNGTTITLASAATAGDLITVESFYVSSVLNAIPANPGSITASYLIPGTLTTAQHDTVNGTGTGAFVLPNGTSAERPAITTNGAVRWNNELGEVEYNILGFWFNTQNGYTRILNKTKATFYYTGAVQTWTVPAGVNYIFVKMWGGGGGGGSYGGWRQGSTGGAGGYSEGVIPVSPGQVLSISVGRCGYARWGANRAWPNGGGASTGGGDNQYAGAGGASTSLVVPSINGGNPCMFAGGGGGGGSITGWGRNPGGAGGGLNGEDAFTELISYTPYSIVGRAGTQTGGGAAVSGSNTAGGAGSYNQGGTHNNANCYGGGGGGGYYGGSSGCYNGGNSMSGGGGGSGYVHFSIINGQTLTGMREYPPMANDPDATQASIGTGFRIAVGGDEAANGGNGLCVIYY